MSGHEMVERAEDEHYVRAGVGQLKVAGISDGGGEAGRAEPPVCQVDVARAEIHEMDVVAVIEQPLGMHAGTAADVDYSCRNWRKVAA